MKYLKPFNEDVDSFLEELQDFCETSLVYLTDDDVGIEIDRRKYWKNTYDYGIRIILKEEKSWNDIKDHMIPFLIRLNNRYELDKVNWDNDTVNKNVKINYFIGGSLSVMRIFQNLKDLVDESNETLWINYKLYDIRLYIKGYKKENKKGILTKIKSFFK